MKIALLTCESHVSNAAVRRFLRANAPSITFVGISDPYRSEHGGLLGQIRRLLQSSGPRLLPYLFVNFTLPSMASLFRRPSLSALCSGRGVPAWLVSDVNGEEFHRRFVSSGADAIVTFHFDQILSGATLSLAGKGGFNVHPSLLPKHRGPTPTVHILLDPDPEFGVTIHRLVPRIDAGPILFQERVALPVGTTAIHAAKVSHEAAVEPLTALLRDWSPQHEHADAPTPSPYTSFPTASMLRDLSRRRRRLVDWRDAVSTFASEPG